eukprot:COSAG01_NODE_40998_length_457_cov_0.558659_1_plen_81_part_00
MRADGGSIVAVDNNYSGRTDFNDADLKAVLGLREFEPLASVKKGGIFGKSELQHQCTYAVQHDGVWKRRGRSRLHSAVWF